MTKRRNIDAAEIAKFDSLAHDWWARNGKLKSLHDINPLRLTYINDRSPLKGKRVLDVGCGGGILSEAMAKEGARVTGIDMAEGPLRQARDHAGRNGHDITYLKSTVEDFSEHHANEFAVVTCLELLEHVDDPASVVAACARLVKTGGDVIFATLDRNPISGFLAIFGAEYVLGLLEKGTHQYKRFVKVEELNDYAGAVGLSCSDVTWMHYNPFSKRYYFRKTGRVNYLVHFVRHPENAIQ